jgi:hypothetical protein
LKSLKGFLEFEMLDLALTTNYTNGHKLIWSQGSAAQGVNFLIAITLQTF